MIAAELRPADRGAVLTDLIARWSGDDRLVALRGLARSFAWAEGLADAYLWRTFYEPAEAVIDHRRIHDEWLAPWAAPALAASGASTRHQVVALGWTATLAAVRGDLDGALAIVTALPARIEVENPLAADARELATVLELRGDRVDLPAIDLAGAFEVVQTMELRRGGDVIDDMGVYPAACESDYRAAIRAAQDGDGAPLANVLQRCWTTWIWTHRHLLAVLPRIERDAAAVAEALRWFREDRLSFDLFTELGYAAYRRDLSALAGDAEEAARWQAIVEAHAVWLDDRDRVVALLLWDP